MAESPVVMDPAFALPDTKPISNGYTAAGSHDSHMNISTANGIAQNSPDHFDIFEDSFVNFSNNGPAIIYQENDDNFVDELELERIRHLSTIVEGPAENSNSNSDSDDDYIRLNEVSLLNRQTQNLDESDNLPSIQKDVQVAQSAFLPDPESTNTVPYCEETDQGPPPRDVSVVRPLNDYVEVCLNAPGATSPLTLSAPSSPTHDYDEVETFHRSTASPTIQINSHELDIVDPSPVATQDLPPTCKADTHEVTLLDKPLLAREDAAPTPNGFLAMLDDVLASPPVLNGDHQGQENDGGMMQQGTLGLSFPGEWPSHDDQATMDAFNMEGNDLFVLPNFLPPVTHVDNSCFTGQPVCLDTPSSSQYLRSNSGSSSEYVCISDVIELPNRERNADTAHGNQTMTENAVNTEALQSSGKPASPVVPSHQQDMPTTSPKRAANADVITVANLQTTPTQEVSENPHNASSNLDTGVRRVSRPLVHTLSSPEGSPVVRRRQFGESPLARRKNITSSPVHQRGDLGVLQPLSPEHGLQLNDQYNILRRTLSHSHRRYSTRRRPNRKGRGQAEGEASGGGGGGEMDSSIAQSVDVSPPEQQRWRDILISNEVSPTTRRSEGYETHVDHHGRTYVMDHRTRTIAFDGQRRRTRHGTTETTSDLDARRQMLDRRYQSLNRSFRRNERPDPPSRRSQRAGLSPSVSNTLEDSNMSLTLTREEADAMLRRGSNATAGTPSSSRSKSKKKRNSSGSGSGRRWPFSRKSSKSISQQGTLNASDDILVVSPSPIGGDLEFSVPDPSSQIRSSVSPQRSTSGSVDSESSLTRSSGVNVDDRVGVSSEQGVIRRESGNVVTETQQGDSEITELGARHMSPEISDLNRQDSIVRSSWLSGADRTAAQVARRRANSRVSQSQDSEESAIEVSEPHTPASPLSPASLLSSVDIVVEDEEDEVKEKESELSKALTYCPALKFVTRKDLFSFLSSAGEAGKMFIASRALMELVQRIRSDNILLEKYQHSRHLVNALNRFADQEADLPEGWEKKLNQQGKVFFIDHEHKITTFIDPRLPLPNTVFTYNTRAASASISATRRSALFDEQEIRPHHVTTVSTSSSAGELTPPTLNESTPARDETTPTPSEADGPASGGPESSSGPPTYQTQVVAFFRRADVVDVINGRYQRGVRPQFRNIIEEVRLLGVPALERIQVSGSIAAYELALVLSLFEEDIARIQLTAQNITTTPAVVVTTAQPSPTTNSKNTLQRKKEAFSTKLQHFKIMMVRLGFAQGSRLKFNIRRDHLLEDAYEHVMKSDIKQLQIKRLNISFKGEDGLDYGGPSREFFFLLSREIFNPYYGLFEYSANDTYTVQVNPTSEFLQNSVDWFRFAGRVMGLVIVQGFLLDAFFTRTFYKALLSRPPILKDLEALEPAFYNSLLWIRENDPEPLDLTFTIEEEAFGELRTHELKEGGLDLLVTDDNKELYITLMLKWRLDRGVAKQMEVLKKGFAEVMPPHLLVDFDASELEFITAGTVEIDVEDWKTHTEYRNGYHAAHPVIIWFWKAIEKFTNEQRLRLLQFVTGTSSVPFEGFKALRGSNGPKRFTVDYFNDANAFPRTHTCFNRIDLPPYGTYDTLYDKLLFAVQEGGGFGME